MPSALTTLRVADYPGPYPDLSGLDLLLLGVVGSTAYGLSHEGSDLDRQGIYLAPTTAVLGLNPSEAVDRTRVSKAPGPDAVVHELGKFARLALKGSPTVLEVLFLSVYEQASPVGEELVALRSAFLSDQAIRSSYGGYASQQAKRLANRAEAGKDGFGEVGVGRTAKHGRHCLRLLRQGRSLLATGTLELDVSGQRDELFAAGDLAVSDPEAFRDLFERELAVLDSIASVLPAQPDVAAVEDFIVRTRLGQLNR